MHRGAFIMKKGKVMNMIKLSYTNLIKKIATGTAILGMVLTMNGCGSYNAEITWEIEEEITTSEATASDTEQASQEADMICVFVTGAVNDRGVYLLPQGSRLYEAIEAAGGMTQEADLGYLNQAKVLEDAEQIVVPTTQEVQLLKEQKQQEEQDAGLVNINTADVAQLMQLSGIGQSRAEAIIAYREKCGRFTQIEDIQLVTGIKAGLYEKIKDKITVG